MDEKKQQEDQEMKEFLARERSVTLTEDEWVCLSTYILFTIDYRLKQANGWKERIKDKQPDGTPAFPEAAAGAEFWERVDRTLCHICQIINAPYLSVLSSKEAEDLCGQ